MNKRGETRSEYMKKWYAANKERVATQRLNWPSAQKETRAVLRRSERVQATTKAYNQSYAETTKGRALRLVLSAKKRALKGGLPFMIEVGDVLPFLEAGTCQRTGIVFDLTAAGDRGKRRPFAPSIDQVMPGAGYTKNNIEVVCWIYNVCKSDFDAADVRTFANALAARSS